MRIFSYYIRLLHGVTTALGHFFLHFVHIYVLTPLYRSLSPFSTVYMRYNFSKHATKCRCHKRKKTTKHIWPSGVRCAQCFYFIFFWTFFLILFPSFSSVTVFRDDDGNEDVWSIDWMPNMHMHAKYDDIIVKLCIFCAKFRYIFFACAPFSAKGCRRAPTN